MKKLCVRLITVLLSVQMIFSALGLGFVNVYAADVPVEISPSELYEEYFTNPELQFEWYKAVEGMGYDIDYVDSFEKFNALRRRPVKSGNDYEVAYDQDGEGDDIVIRFTDINLVFDSPIIDKTVVAEKQTSTPGEARFYKNNSNVPANITLEQSNEVTTTLGHSSTESYSHEAGVAVTVSAGVPGGIFGVEVTASYSFTYNTETSTYQELSDTESIGASVGLELPPFSCVKVGVTNQVIPYYLNYDGSIRITYNVVISGDDENAAAFARNDTYADNAENNLGDNIIEIGHTRHDMVGFDAFKHIDEILKLYYRRGGIDSASYSFTWDDYDTNDDDDTTEARRVYNALSAIYNDSSRTFNHNKKYKGKFLFETTYKTFEVEPISALLPLNDIQLKSERDEIIVNQDELFNISELGIVTKDSYGNSPFIGFEGLLKKWYLDDTLELTSYDENQARTFFDSISSETEVAEVYYNDRTNQFYIKGLKEGVTYLNMAVLYNRFTGNSFVEHVLTTEDTMIQKPVKVRVIGKPAAPHLNTLQLTGAIDGFKLDTGVNTVDLSKLDVRAFDQYGVEFSGVDETNCEWVVTSSIPNGAFVLEGNVLTVSKSGIFTVQAKSGNVVSPQIIEFVVDAAPEIASIQITNRDVQLYTNSLPFDLSGLTVTAKDQYGKAFATIPQLSYHNEKGNMFLTLNGKMITPNFVGTDYVWVECKDLSGNTITSNKIPVSIKSAPYPAKVEWLDAIGPMYIGTASQNIDLRTINLKVTDQYGNPYDYNKDSVIWSIGNLAKGKKVQASITDKFMLNAINAGSITISAAIPSGSGDKLVSTLIQKTISIYETKEYLAKLEIVAKNPSFKSIAVGSSSAFADTFDVYAYNQFGVKIDSAGYTVQWNSGDTDITVSADGKLFGGSFIGSAPLFVTATNENGGIVKSNEFIVNVTDEPAISVIDIKLRDINLNWIDINQTLNFFDLFVITGIDQFGNNIDITNYDFMLMASNNNVSISNDNDTITGVNIGNTDISVSVQNEKGIVINSNVYNLVVGSKTPTTEIVSLLVNGYIPPQGMNTSFDLRTLEVVGLDGNGNKVSLEGKSYSWKLISGDKYFTLDGSILYFNKKGVGELVVYLDNAAGITSTPVRVLCGNDSKSK